MIMDHNKSTCENISTFSGQHIHFHIPNLQPNGNEAILDTMLYVTGDDAICSSHRNIIVYIPGKPDNKKRCEFAREYNYTKNSTVTVKMTKCLYQCLCNTPPCDYINLLFRSRNHQTYTSLKLCDIEILYTSCGIT